MSKNLTNEFVTAPLYVEKGVDIKDFGLDPKDIKTIRIGNRKIKVIYIQCPPEQKDALMKIFWHRVNMDKKSARESRCTVQGKYGPIRCPESRKCSECEYGQSLDRKNCSTVSLDALRENDSYEPADQRIPQEEAMIELFLEEMIEYLEEIHHGYGSAFKLMYDGVTNRREIGKALGVPTGTIKDWIPKIRKLAEDFYFCN